MVECSILNNAPHKWAQRRLFSNKNWSLQVMMTWSLGYLKNLTPRGPSRYAQLWQSTTEQVLPPLHFPCLSRDGFTLNSIRASLALTLWMTISEFECCDCDGPSILYFFSKIIYSLFLKPYPFTCEFCLFHFQLSWAAEAADQNPSPNGRLVIM